MKDEILFLILKHKIDKIIRLKKIPDRAVIIETDILSPEEAIGNPLEKDYPILKGKEKLLRARYNNSIGVAFTDMYGSSYETTLSEIINMELNNNYKRAIFIATINAFLRNFGFIDKTEHCKNQRPVECAKRLIPFLKNNYGNDLKIFLAGFQPRFAEVLSKNFEIRITDNDDDNINKIKYANKIYSPKKTFEFIEWSNLVFVTGSIFVNNTASNFIREDKKVIFYGVTAAGPAYLLDLPRYCIGKEN